MQSVFGVSQPSQQAAQRELSDMLLLRVPSDGQFAYHFARDSTYAFKTVNPPPEGAPQPAEQLEAVKTAEPSTQPPRAPPLLKRMPSTVTRALSLQIAPEPAAGAEGGVDERGNEDAYLTAHAAQNILSTLVRLVKATTLHDGDLTEPNADAVSVTLANSGGATSEVTTSKSHLLVEALQVSGHLALMQGAYAKARVLLRQAYELAQEHPYGSCYFALGSLAEQYSRALVALLQHDLALEVLKTTSKQLEALHGNSMHWQQVPLCVAMAALFVDRGRAQEAETHAKRAVGIALENLGAKHVRTAQAQATLAHVLLLQGHYEDAAAKLRSSIDITRRAGWQAAHPLIAQHRFALALCQAALGEYEEAEQQAQLATDICVQLAAGEAQRAAATLYGHGMRARMLVLQGRFDSAASVAQKILLHPLSSSSSRLKADAADDKGGGASGHSPLPPLQQLEDDGRVSFAQATSRAASRLAVGSDGSGSRHDGVLETDSSRIAAHLVLAQVCRVRGEQLGALKHAALARAQAQHRYAPSHPTAIEAALEWARAHTALLATPTAHLEAEVVVLEARAVLEGEYGPHDAPAPHPLHFRVASAMAEVLSAKHQHADAMRCVRMATVGRETLMLRLHPHTAALSNSLSNSVSNSAAPAPRTAWVVAEARLEHAKCALAAGMYTEALQVLGSFFSCIDELGPLDARMPNTATAAASGVGKEQMQMLGSTPSPLLFDHQHHAHADVLQQVSGGVKAPPPAPLAPATPPPLRDARLHKLGRLVKDRFVWYEDEETSSEQVSKASKAVADALAPHPPHAPQAALASNYVLANNKPLGNPTTLTSLRPPAGAQLTDEDAPLEPREFRFSTLAQFLEYVNELTDESVDGIDVFVDEADGPRAAVSVDDVRLVTSSNKGSSPQPNDPTLRRHPSLVVAPSLNRAAGSVLSSKSSMSLTADLKKISKSDSIRLPNTKAGGVIGGVRSSSTDLGSSASSPLPVESGEAPHGEQERAASRAPPAYRTLRLVEVAGMHVQIKLLVCMCRWKLALDSIAQVTASLPALNIKSHAALDDAPMLEALCFAGMGYFDQAEGQLRDIAQHLLQVKVQGGSGSGAEASGSHSAISTWAIGHERDRYFMCVKAAGRLREVMNDFVGASGDYMDCAQSWMLSNDPVSRYHPFVAEASFCAAIARHRCGMSDAGELETSLNRLTKALGAQHPVVSDAQIDVSEMLIAQHKTDEAETLLLEARNALKIACGENHPSMARCIFLLASVYEQRGPAGRRYGDVIKMLDTALAVILRATTRRHVALFPILAVYANVCSKRGSGLLDQEVLLRRWALRVLGATHSSGSLLVDAFRNLLVECLQQNNKIPEARYELVDMLQKREASHGMCHLTLCDVLLRLVDLELFSGHKLVDETKRQLFALEVTFPARHDRGAGNVDDLDPAKLQQLQHLRAKLPALEAAFKVRLNDAAKLLERSLAIKMLHKQTASNAGASVGSFRALASRDSDEEDLYALECCPELERLGQVYGIVGDLKEATRSLTSAIATRQREIRNARQAKDAVIPGHSRLEQEAAQRLSAAVLNKAESQRMLAAIISEGAGAALTQAEAAAHAHAAEDLYREAMNAVTLELGLEHPRTLAIKTALAALCRSQEHFDTAQRLFEYN